MFDITVYGAFLPRHIFYRLHAVCAYLRCMFVALCLLFMWPSFDIILADQVSVVVPILKLKKSAKVFWWIWWNQLLWYDHWDIWSLYLMQVVFYCHFPDLLLAQRTTILRRIYRKPIDFIEEITTGFCWQSAFCPWCLFICYRRFTCFFLSVQTSASSLIAWLNYRNGRFDSG